ncbi:hypothetical protein JX265_003236 [Neoarthrinium moseri]|uniref:SSCRP protein n=1 Tax=Neoarthrinium moseri TaxID=1658444 RepID=A0A9P9WTI4_9PEZI|nr:uncharacterized protein JN550_005524 [Neoarthrinium moseri]KAI1852749.1 hypothetical protein JX266_002290 [Neoarthrinium moseri]KAI1869934.1 hypothetical protein JN550_005524 [Neoarthrinium moseri]KAI1879059.1 hypothetical protein JX265_003236 [Neoarthrinium moseri]
MQTFAIVALLAAASNVAFASPVSDSLFERDNVPSVGFGQQLQTSSEANYWVIWEHGKSACPATRTLSQLTDSPCDIAFSLPSRSDKVKLCECNGNNEPQSLCTEKGDVIRGCSQKNYKITCHGDTHDIVQHGHCDS